MPFTLWKKLEPADRRNADGNFANAFCAKYSSNKVRYPKGQ